jgi:hypothetical protein
MIQTTGDRNETDTRSRRAFSRKFVFPAFLFVGAVTAAAVSYAVAFSDSEGAEAVLSPIEATAHPFGALMVDLRSRMSAPAKLASLTPPPAVREAPLADTTAPAPAHAAPPRATPAAEHVAPLPPRRPTEFAFPFGREGFRAPTHGVVVPKKTALSPAPADNRSLFERFFGALQPTNSALAYAPSDTRVSDAWRRSANPALRYEEGTAVYDISGHTVYLPDGTKLEAHSGLGDKFDDPRFAHVRMRGVTPPHVYDLTLREKPFHGVRAIRLTPIGGEANIFGRVGLLAHTYMLGPRGDSNGCVSFRNYQAFLHAFEKGDVKRLVVVARLD